MKGKNVSLSQSLPNPPGSLLKATAAPVPPLGWGIQQIEAPPVPAFTKSCRQWQQPGDAQR